MQEEKKKKQVIEVEHNEMIDSYARNRSGKPLCGYISAESNDERSPDLNLRNLKNLTSAITEGENRK